MLAVKQDSEFFNAQLKVVEEVVRGAMQTMQQFNPSQSEDVVLWCNACMLSAVSILYNLFAPDVEYPNIFMEKEDVYRHCGFDDLCHSFMLELSVSRNAEIPEDGVSNVSREFVTLVLESNHERTV